MLRITLKNTDLVRVSIPRYNRFLEKSALKVVTQTTNESADTIEIQVNTHIFGQRYVAKKLAEDCFDISLLKVVDE